MLIFIAGIHFCLYYSISLEPWEGSKAPTTLNSIVSNLTCLKVSLMEGWYGRSERCSVSCIHEVSNYKVSEGLWGGFILGSSNSASKSLVNGARTRRWGVSAPPQLYLQQLCIFSGLLSGFPCKVSTEESSNQLWL